MPPRTTKDILGKTKKIRKDKKRKNHYFLKTVLSIFFGFSIGFGIMFFIHSLKAPNVSFSYSGPEEISFRVGDTYENTTVPKAINSGTDETKNVETLYFDSIFNQISEIDTNIAGTYYVGYKYTTDHYSNILYQKILVNEIGPVDDFSIHFMELGNGFTGESIYIKAGQTDILIDAGSRQNSAESIISYVNNYCTDGILEYVIATNARQEHISAFSSTTPVNDDEIKLGIFDSFICKTIIDFPKTNSNSSNYLAYKAALDKEVTDTQGAVHYNALQCYSNENGAKRSYTIASGITMNILYNYYYDHATNDERDYSVCLMFNVGDRKVLLTSDLSSSGTSYLITNNPGIKDCDVFKANSHGETGSNPSAFLNFVNPKLVAVSCCAGSKEYSTIIDKQFPSQDFITNISPITEEVYVTSLSLDGTTSNYTSMNGTIIMTSLGGDEFVVDCSNNNTKLKDSEWFAENRIWG